MLDQDAAHQQAAMAMSRIFLAAQQSYAKRDDPALQSFYTFHECRIGLHAAVEHVPVFVVIRRISRAATQFAAKKNVFDPALSKFSLHDFTVELRGKAGIGRGPSVHNHIDLMACQKPGKVLPGVR